MHKAMVPWRNGNARDSCQYLAELKQLVQLHAQAQGIRPKSCRQILNLIESDGGGADNSWVSVWSAAALQHEALGDHRCAYKYYNMARFPYVDGRHRAGALRKCVAAFERWARTVGIQRLELTVGDSQVQAWMKASAVEPRRLLLMLGGIVSIKEQWGDVLLNANRLGMTIAITEMPGVGENTMTYDGESWRMLSALLDKLGPSYGSDLTYAAAMSFGGHLAMRAALSDSRIKGIVTAGAPISDFFTCTRLWPGLPETTVRTLANIAKVRREDLQAHIARFAFTDNELAEIEIPLYYVASLRDEIIPRSDWQRLGARAPRAKVVEFDDVHGAPRHLAEYRIGILRELLTMQGRSGLQRAALGAVQAALAARRRASLAFPFRWTHQERAIN